MKTPRRGFAGIVYRAHHPMWAYDALSGNGAKKYGGRFNRPGCAALYTAIDPTTAWMEAQQGFSFKPQPMTLVAYEAICKDIVDLNDGDVLKSLGCSALDLGCPWEYMATQNQEPSTWLLVDRLLHLGIAGILVRSFAPGCTANNQNLVLWKWTEAESNTVRIIDDFGRLPKTRGSWLGE
ncbi:RES domain-containing protein [Methylomonas sp. AM2-LC]|uniref:RES family NAD+ phosphorylase n=1 Tax=Methylomonas sp. AM2-LC TaxID=3153301 RepID=UPI0032676F11